MAKGKKTNPYKADKAASKKGFKNLLTAKSLLGLVVRIVILMIIPYAYLMLCGLVFDWWLHMYEMTNFIFYSLIVLAVAAVVLIILTAVWTAKSGNLKNASKKQSGAKVK